MKITVILLLVCCLQVSARVSSQGITLHVKNAPLHKVFQEIRKQTGYSFMYTETILKEANKVSMEVKNSPLLEALALCFASQPFTYKIINQTVVVQPKEKIFRSASAINETPLPPPPIDFHGKVVNQQGEPLQNVSILIAGTQIGTTTTADGRYTLSSPDDKNVVLEISSVGFKTKRITAGKAQTEINVVLELDVTGLSDVIVVGYGTQKKVNLTGAVSQITADDLKNRPVTNVTQALQGEISNLNIVIGSGKPGSSGTLNIRGNTSITSSGEPLVLIDGVPSEIDRVSINDIESITVLKDASASAIYGARAAFGVILLTTKKASKGAPTISYSNNFGMTTHATNTKFITSAYDNIRINEEAYFNALGRNYNGYTDEDYDEIYKRRNDKVEDPSRPWVMIKPDRSGKDVYKYYANFDWFNWFYAKWRPKQQHNISVMGSSGKINYYLSGSVNDETGIMKQNPDSYNKYNFIAKIEAELSSWFTISTSTRYFKSKYGYYGKEGGMFPTVYNNISTNQIYMTEPSKVPVNPDGTGTYLTDNGTYAIGYGAHLSQMNKNLVGKNILNDFTTTVEGKIKISKDLSITGNYSYDLENGMDMYRGTRLTYSLYPGVIQQVPRDEWDRDILKETTSNNNYYVLNVFGNYRKKISDHNMEVTAGYNREERSFKKISSEGQELLSETLNDLNLVTGDKQLKGGSSEWALSGLFYRANYNYAGKYLFEASGRYDGTSRFRKGDRFGFFPSFSLGWRISDEAFFEPLKNTVTNLKLRGSYGSLGNQLVGTYAYISTMPPGLVDYLMNGRRITAVSAPNPVSPNLTWEMTVSRNIGLDVALFDNRLGLSVDGYIRDTKGMLIKGKTLPRVFGAPEPRENAGDLRTQGFEVSINWKDQLNVLDKPFNYFIGINLSDYTGKITKFDNPTNIISDYYVGKKLGEIWGFVYDGYFKTNQEASDYPVNQDILNPRRVQAPTLELRKLQAGDIRIRDLNNNNKIDFGAGTVDNPGDRAIIGNSQPRYSFGIPLGASWNGIELNILLQGIVHQHYYPDLENAMFWGPYARPYASFIPIDFEQKIWKPDNTDSYFPRMIGYIAQNSEMRYENNMYLQDIGYMKLRNLSLGYSIPAKITSRIKLNSMRVYVSGENLYTWTRFENDYIDPQEVMWDKTGRTYPMGKAYSLGLDIKF